MRRMPLASGATFAGFTIVRLLGTGGSGAVYLAEHPRSPRRIALKLLRADVSADPDFRDRFNREADLAATFDHPNIVAVLDRGEHSRRLWLATDYVDGPDARTLLRERYRAGMPPSAVSLVVDRIARALDFAHRQGLLHRHVKPANIMLDDPYSSAYRILLTDFGTSRRLDNCRGPNTPAGLLRYAAPEQLTGSGLEGRTDQYGLAATAFHLLTGIPPFSGGYREVRPPALADTHSNLAEVDPVFAKALASEPADRYDTCGDFAAALVEPSGARGTVAATAMAPPPPVIAQASPASASPATTAIASPPIAEPPDQYETSAAGQPSARDPAGEASASVAAKNPLLRSTLVPAALALLAAVVLTVVGVLLPGKTGPSSAPGPQSSRPGAASPSATPSAPPEVALPLSVCGDPQAVVTSLSIRDELAQLLMVGVKGADDARTVVAVHRVGGIFIGGWTDLSMLTDGSLRNIADSAGPLSLAVSVDEEGGRVQRLSSLLGDQPSARALVAGNTTLKRVHDIAYQRGTAMKSYGITIDFAPVVDVSDAPDDTVIGDRSFSSNPDAVMAYAGAYAQGLRDAGLLPVLKHFPGHGHGSGDSHKGGVTTPQLDDLKNDDLIPYRTLTTQGPVGVMVGHLQVPGLTGTDPASLSKPAYDLLRSGNYGGAPFTGAVFTDDLSSMAAINQRYSLTEAVLRALQAGADTALWITTDQVPAVLDRLVQAVNAHELPKERVDEAARRVALAKGTSPHCGG